MACCWYCHWGWSEQVANIYKEAVRRLDGHDSVLHWSSGHVVWEDENFDHAEYCLEHFDEYKGDYSEEEFNVLRWSLEELSKIPLEIRCPEPEEVGEKDAEDCPPPPGIKMVFV